MLEVDPVADADAGASVGKGTAGGEIQVVEGGKCPNAAAPPFSGCFPFS